MRGSSFHRSVTHTLINRLDGALRTHSGLHGFIAFVRTGQAFNSLTELVIRCIVGDEVLSSSNSLGECFRRELVATEVLTSLREDFHELLLSRTQALELLVKLAVIVDSFTDLDALTHAVAQDHVLERLLRSFFHGLSGFLCGG